jgi:hypothetical protein
LYGLIYAHKLSKEFAHQCYGLLRIVSPLPRADWVRAAQEECTTEVDGTVADLGEDPPFLAHYRERHGIAAGRCHKVILGPDATSLDKTGVVLEKPAKPPEGVMAFLMMPLDHDPPKIFVHLHPTATMKVDPAAESIKEQLLPIISAAGLDTVGVAADGDPGTNAQYKALETVYQDLPAEVMLDPVMEALEARERVLTRTGWEMAVTDMLYWLGWLLQCRGREGAGGVGVTLAHQRRAAWPPWRVCPPLGKPGAHVQNQDGAGTWSFPDRQGVGVHQYRSGGCGVVEAVARL